MKIRPLILSVIAVISANLLYAQTTGSGALVNEESDALVGGMSDLMLYTTVKSGPEEITGNPFLYEDWGNSGVVYSGGVAHSISKLNYNLYTDEIAELKTKNEVFVFDKEAIDSLVIQGLLHYPPVDSVLSILSFSFKDYLYQL